MSDYSYSIANDTANGVADLDILQVAITPSLPALLDISTLNDTLTFHFPNPISAGDETILTDLLASHSGDMLAPYRALIENAILFFSKIMIIFAAENITLGITSAGKTKEVSDYLTDVLRYGQTGSLYEVIGTIDTLVAAGVPVDLTPFATEARLLEFKGKITEYLA